MPMVLELDESHHKINCNPGAVLWAGRCCPGAPWFFRSRKGPELVFWCKAYSGHKREQNLPLETLSVGRVLMFNSSHVSSRIEQNLMIDKVM